MSVLDSAATPPSSRTAAPIDREWGEDRELDMFGGVMFVWRFRYVIVSATLLAAVLGFLATRLMPKEYTAISTVYVNIPRTQNPLAPDPLSVEALDRLASSEMMLSQVGAEMRKAKVLGDADRVFQFRTVLYPSTEPQKPFLPLLGLSVIASSGTVAREAANIWATVMIAETRKLAAATRASAVDFIVSEYPKAAQRLNAEELNLETLKRQQEAALQAVKNTAAVSLKEGQLWSREQLVVTLEEQRNRLTLDLEETAASVKALEQELAKVPPVIVVRKGLTDDGVLDSAARGGGKLPPSVADARLQTEQVNPVHTELTRRLSEARVRLTELSASRPVLDAQIDRTRRDALSIRAALGNGVLSISNLERQHEVEAAAKGREVESARANFRKLEEQIGDAQIVMADKESSIMLGSLAELPETPSGPRVARTVGAFGLAGLALALFAAWIADRASKRTAPA